MRRFILLAVVAAAVLAAALAAYHVLPRPWRFAYEGEGVFVDRGIAAPSNRYWLRVAAIDLTKPSEHRYLIGVLPQATSNLGLRIAPATDETLALVADLTVRIGVVDAVSGGALYQYEGPLYQPRHYQGEFTPFSYSSAGGEQTLVMYTSAYEPCERVQVFRLPTPLCRPAPRVLSFAVVEPIDSKPLPATVDLVIFAGGWK